MGNPFHTKLRAYETIFEKIKWVYIQDCLISWKKSFEYVEKGNTVDFLK